MRRQAAGEGMNAALGGGIIQQILVAQDPVTEPVLMIAAPFPICGIAACAMWK